MERWAKNVNAAKSAQQQQLQAVIEQERSEAAAAPPEVYTDPTPSLSNIQRTGVPLASALQKVCLDTTIIKWLTLGLLFSRSTGQFV